MATRRPAAETALVKRNVGTSTRKRPEASLLNRMAPWPRVDAYPTILGSQITLKTLSSAFRMCLTGQRRMYVDLLDELLEREPHGYGTLSQRILRVSQGRFDILPAKVGEGRGDKRRKKKAEEIADRCRRDFHDIPNLRRSLADLQWAVYYGPTASEALYEPASYGGLRPVSLEMIHSRRISYNDIDSWEPYIYDQDLFGKNLGLRIADYPGKFLFHAPRVRGDYPTREGLGRELAWWFAIKGMTARSATQYIERYGKPFATGSYTTSDDKTPRPASDEDIEAGDKALAAIATGSFAGAMLPDNVVLHVIAPGAGSTATMSHSEWLDYCDKQISRATLGQDDTTTTSSIGSRSKSEVSERSVLAILRFDASQLAETVRRDLITTMVRLNFPFDQDLVPQVHLIVDEDPGPDQYINVVKNAVSIGMPVDGQVVAQRLGLPLTDPTNEFRLVPTMAVVPPGFEDEMAASYGHPLPGSREDLTGDAVVEAVKKAVQTAKTAEELGMPIPRSGGAKTKATPVQNANPGQAAGRPAPKPKKS